MSLAADFPISGEDLRRQSLFPVDAAGDGDTFIASYPKSGVTWLQHLTGALIFGLDGRRVHDRVVQTVIPDMHHEKVFLRVKGMPSILKWHGLPEPRMKRVVHLVRDGRDVAVSYYHMLRGMGQDITLAEVVAGEGLWPCSWAEHSLAWQENPYGAEVLQIRYEDLLVDPLPVLEVYLEFCRWECSREEISAAIEQCSFGSMSAKEKKLGWGTETEYSGGAFIRVGRAREYMNEMPQSLIEDFNASNGGVLTSLGYEK